ncbi:hypothetical protein [Desulfogranum mediterraneum]|uniref:hypothetical protein n=1 Tax=Desulfogranum mediterraneum TaxID=160661 RepID=UPI0004176F35|nr:hypothetical protein [Desulfogranum mediterraneum]
MKKAVTLSLSLMLCSIMVGCTQNDTSSTRELKPITYLTADEVKNLHSDHTAYGTNLRYNKQVEVHYSADGTYAGTVASGKKKISGTWLVKKDGAKCNSSDRSDNSFCMKYSREGDSYYGFFNGEKRIKVQFR